MILGKIHCYTADGRKCRHYNEENFDIASFLAVSVDGTEEKATSNRLRYLKTE